MFECEEMKASNWLSSQGCFTGQEPENEISRHSLYWSLFRALRGLSRVAAPIGSARSPRNQSPVYSNDSGEAWRSADASINSQKLVIRTRPRWAVPGRFSGVPVSAKILN